MLVHIWCAPTWRFHTELCKFLRNILPNVCGLGERTDLKLGEVSCLFIFNRITISWLYPLNGFRFIFFTACQWKRSIHSSDTQVEVLSVILRWSCNCNVNIKQDSSQLVWFVTPHTKVDTICCERPSWRLQWWWFENSTSLTKVHINRRKRITFIDLYRSG